MDAPLLASLFEDEERRPHTVSEVNSEIKSALESRFASVWVEGEISGFMAASSGHWYFKLTDGDSFLKAVCFKGQNFRIRFKPTDGLQVRVRGRRRTGGGRDGIKIQHTGTRAFPQIRFTDAADIFKASIGVDTSGTGSMNMFINGADRMILKCNGVAQVPGPIFINNPNTLIITSPNGA